MAKVKVGGNSHSQENLEHLCQPRESEQGASSGSLFLKIHAIFHPMTHLRNLGRRVLTTVIVDSGVRCRTIGVYIS